MARSSIIFEWNDKKHEISAYFLRPSRGPWNDGSNLMHNMFMCFFGVPESGKKAFFTYYGSNIDYKNGIKELDENGLFTALYCFVSDALSGAGSYDDFISEFGENENSKKTYKACKESFKKLSNVFDGWYPDINSLYEYILETYNI